MTRIGLLMAILIKFMFPPPHSIDTFSNVLGDHSHLRSQIPPVAGIMLPWIKGSFPATIGGTKVLCLGFLNVIKDPRSRFQL